MAVNTLTALTLHTISQQREIDNLKERLEKIESNSTGYYQISFKSQAENGLLIATLAIFAIVIVKEQILKLIKKQKP
ncbi:MAG: hypothetical protein J5I91_09390 [Bacteroidetes bacterium]|nr:hypothetical protein [Bacteroidota bacterium]